MTLRALLTAFAAVTMFGCSGSGGGELIPTRLRIMPLGDSITHGSGGTNAGYRRFVENAFLNRVNFEFVGSQSSGAIKYPRHEGHPGWSIRQYIGEEDGTNYAANFVQSAQPDVIFLLLGTNDAQQEIDEASRRYRKLLEEIYRVAPRVKIVWLEVTPRTAPTDWDEKWGPIWHEAMRLIAEEYRLKGKIIVTEPSPAGFDKATMLTDNVHPNDAGYQLIADAFIRGFEAVR